jgi:glutathione S-transferase
MLKVWGRHSAANVQKVMWLIGELGIDHEHIPCGGVHGGLDHPAFLALNPNGLVPVIDDDGAVVWESHAILRYLAARYGADRFWSDDPYSRSLFDRWLDWCRSFQQDFLDGVFWGFYRTPEAERNWPAIHQAITRSGEWLAILDQELEGRPFILGAELSLADVPVGALLYRYFGLEIERPTLPNVEALYERLKARPSYQQHVMVPFEELRGRLDRAGT